MAAFSSKSFYSKPSGSKCGVQRALELIQNDNSDIDELSDGDDYDPGEAVNSTQQDDNSSDESDNTESSDDEVTSEEIQRNNSRWIHTDSFDPNLIKFTPTVDPNPDEREDWTPEQYFKTYIDEDFASLISHNTNVMSVSRSGQSINTSAAEIMRFLGMSVYMSCVRYPRVKMFWSRSLKIPTISDCMGRDRYFRIRSNLKLVDDNSVSDEEKKSDRFWKVRPIMNRVLQGCHTIPRPANVSIDEQMIPFSGSCPYRQYIPSKPNPVGIKNFVLATPDGLMLDFELYQGISLFQSSVLLGPNSNLGLGGSVISHLSQSLQPGTNIYCDRYFVSLKLIDYMYEKGLYVTGPVMKNRIADPIKKLKSDKELKKEGRGSVDSIVRRDNKLCVTKWFDNKPVIVLSAVHGVDPTDGCRRWSKDNKNYVTIPRPNVIKEYNNKMGGVDMADRMISFYRLNVRTKKWTIRVIMHFVDTALVNSWLMYRQDALEMGIDKKKVMPFLDFRLAVADELIHKIEVGRRIETDSNSDDELVPVPAKRARTVAIPSAGARLQEAKHMPEMMNIKNAMRCRLPGCNSKSTIRCKKCNVYLCIKNSRNCFAEFHE